MIRAIRPDVARALAVLVCGALGCARAPSVVREPPWTGAAPSTGAPSYAETLEVLQFLVEEYSQGLRQRVASPAPCVLRIVRSDDLSRYPRAAPGSTYESTWIDLSRVTELHAKATDREPGAGTSAGSTCAWFGGARGFALRTDLAPAKGKAPRRDTQLAREASPRVCLGGNAHPERLAEPLRQLVALCGGRTGKGRSATEL